jgi:hypothetical protein
MVREGEAIERKGDNDRRIEEEEEEEEEKEDWKQQERRFLFKFRGLLLARRLALVECQCSRARHLRFCIESN